MKTKITILAILVLFISVIALTRTGKSSDPKCVALAGNRPLDVNALMEAPDCSSGKIQVQGAVNSVLPDKRTLILIDLSEEDNCEDGCPIKRLPVVWNGTMPSKGDHVLASGAVTQQGRKFLFAAESLSPLPKSVSQ